MVGMDGFVIEKTAKCQMAIRKRYAAIVRRAFLDNTDCETFEAEGGRGVIWTFPLTKTDSTLRGLLRLCRRGGIIRFLLRDTYILNNRPLREFEVHRYAEANGLNVPLLLGVRWGSVGGIIFYRGALATQLIPNARSLDVVLLESGSHSHSYASQAGTLIRKMHDLGIWHADLNVKNIVFDNKNFYLLDFDNARIVRPMKDIARARNMLRLRRSMNKHALESTLYEAMLSGYGACKIPVWLTRLYHWKWYLSDLL